MLFYQLCIVLAVVLSLLTTTHGAYCHGSPAPGERTNDFPIFDMPLRHVRSVKNAVLYEAGPHNASFPVVHVWGTPYELGFAQGTLMKKDIVAFVDKVWAYLNSGVIQAMTDDRVPEWLKVLISTKGMDKALDWTRRTTEAFTPQAYFDEVRGLADATGLDYDMLYRVQMFPELTKAQCSFLGAWGEAVKKTGYSYQLRALDFDTTGPFKDYPQVTVYHPDEGHAYAQVGWPGDVGALTGFSSRQIAVSEIGVSYPDDSFEQGTENTKPEKVHGEPWMFILRDVLQFEDSLESAKARVAAANRTCNLIIGLGDGKAEKVNGVQFSGYVSNFYEDFNLLPVNETWHQPIKDVVYNGMDWLCPGYNSVLNEQLNKFHGALDETVIVHDILPTAMTGDLHIAVYDLHDSNMHVSFCRGAKADATEPQNAYERQFTRLHMNAIFDEPRPN
jgi:isopenicillin-N N-acyltransferase like protein